MSDMQSKDYNFSEIEARWQKYWEENKTYKADNQGTKPKYYVLDMFPYPSGNGLHVGHPKGYVGSDIIARYKRMAGFDVLHPMGWDAFGLPTERQAAREGTHPEIITKRNVDRFRNQLKKIGLSYDWDREISTTDPRYYRWTQWIFLKLYEMGLAYQAEISVNWCPALGTVLANEEVKDGVYVETGDPVEKRLMKQWMLKITAYSERLIKDLDLVDWPESIKEMQRNWIGKSVGALVKFDIADTDLSFNVFTTRPDTLFGGTYCVLAPEHALVSQIVTEEQKQAVEEYVDRTSKMSERDRMIKAEEKTGVFTGAYAICPVNNKKLPVWISDYVLASYGTGAVFACPSHDERDHAFAKKFNLPIIEVVKGGKDVQEEAYTGDGEHVNSEYLDGLNTADAINKVIEWLEANNSGKSETNYKLRDWLFSRQRYWGEPIPIMIDPETGETYPVSEDELPLVLPPLDDISPAADGQPPLAKLTDWVNIVDKKTGKKLQRETNTMPQWAGSCWYYLGFMDPYNESEPWDKNAEKKWAPVDLYVGGTEHATLHLLYARFWHKVLFDLGYVSTPEPFHKLFNQGLVQAKSYQDERGKYYYPDQVYEKNDKWFTKEGDLPLKTKVEKMSKSLYNVVTPDEVIEKYGADSLRLYELFMGPLEDGVVWQTENITGVKRFLERIWNLFHNNKSADTMEKSVESLMHKTIKKVTEDIEKLQFNTAISQLMIFVNELYKQAGVTKEAMENLVKLISPMAPHMAEEIWQKLGNTGSIAHVQWPTFDPELTKDDKVEIPVQIGGKLRGTIMIDVGADQETVKNQALNDEAIGKLLEGKTIMKVIYVPNKILNFIAK